MELESNRPNLRALSLGTAREGARWGPGSGTTHDDKLKRRYPTSADLDSASRRRLPRFAYDFLNGGTGDELGARRNHRALDEMQLTTRVGIQPLVNTTTSIFGQSYAVPFGIAPTGNDGMIWPNASLYLARAAAETNMPYIAGTLASASIEEISQICPDQFWFQLYGMPRDDHKTTRALIRRAQASNARALVLSIDAPVRAKRPRDLKHGLTVPFRISTSTVRSLLTSPAWSRAAVSTGLPLFANLAPYAGDRPSLGEVAAFVQNEMRGSFTWEEVTKIRSQWDGPLVIKGIMHPDDAATAFELGADGIIVSNHGGRQSDAAPAAIDCLSEIVDQTRAGSSVFFDSGVRSGLDVAKALILGAKMAFSGRTFLSGLGAIGDGGARYVATMLEDELRTAMAQNGANTVSSLRDVCTRRGTTVCS